MVGWNLLLIPLIALLRGVFGWLENAAGDGVINLPEWKKLGETVLRMSLPILGLVWAFNLDPVSASGIGLALDWTIVKLYNAIKKK